MVKTKTLLTPKCNSNGAFRILPCGKRFDGVAKRVDLQVKLHQKKCEMCGDEKVITKVVDTNPRKVRFMKDLVKSDNPYALN